MIWNPPRSRSMIPAKYTQPTQPVAVGWVTGPLDVVDDPVVVPLPAWTCSVTGPAVACVPATGPVVGCCGAAEVEPAGVFSPSLMAGLQVVRQPRRECRVCTRCPGTTHARRPTGGRHHTARMIVAAVPRRRQNARASAPWTVTA